jgi:two-component system chemotaxis sensor kinase CheA
MDLSKFYNQFREETTENVRVLNDGLLALEQVADTTEPDARAHVDAMFRAVHTIKGSSRMLGFADIGRLAHTMEDLLGAVRDGRVTLQRDMTDQLLRGGDALLELTTAAIDGQGITIDLDQLVAAITSHIPVPEESGTPADAPQEVPQEASSEAADSQQDGTASEPSAQAAQPAQPASPAPAPAPASNGGVLSATTTTPAAAQPQASPGSAIRSRAISRQTVRVRTDRLDRLINLTGELVIGQQTLALHSQALRDLLILNQQQERTLLMLHAELQQQRLSPDQRSLLEESLNSLLNMSEQANQIVRGEVEQFSQFTNQHHILIDDLEQEVISTRLLPMSTIFGGIPRTVREIANATGKEIELDLRGEATELDRKLLEALNDPLLHLMRNAIDHGIELPDERAAKGKPRQGHISVSAEAYGGEVRVLISDDGRGIDAQQIRESAVRKGLIAAENAALLSEQEALDLIFLPGFTTASILTDLSGRGVGMDVVRTNVSELGGQVVLESQPGEGTQVTLLLPLTLVTTRILLVKVGTHTFALPASGCQGIIWIHEDDINTIEGRAMINHNKRTVPLLRLADLIGVDAPPAFNHETRMPTILLGTARRMLSLLVDSVLDERESVVKPIGSLLEGQRRYTGAIQLGNGQLVLMINPVSLAQAARGVRFARPTESVTTRAHPQLLIADDSFTTRELMRSILHSAGYDVATAVDGVDALDKLQARPYDLVVSDVEMPRMNGFELTASIRRELGLKDLPVIIVTSLASDDHKRQGLEAGAQAYIVKSQFNQDNLLEAIEQLLGH